MQMEPMELQHVVFETDEGRVDAMWSDVRLHAHSLEPGREAYHLGSIYYYATAEQMEAICPAGIDLDRYATLANGNVGYDEADAHWDDAAWWDEQERAMWHGGHGSLTGNGVRHRCRAHPEDFLLAGRLTTRQLPRSETGGFDAFS